MASILKVLKAKDVFKRKKKFKPWRFEYALVLPNSKPIPKDQLKSMVLDTKKIESDEDHHLNKIALTNRLNRTPVIVPPLATFAKKLMAWLNLLLGGIFLLILIGCTIFLSSKWKSFVDKTTIYSMLIGTLIVLGLAALGYVSASSRSRHLLLLYLCLMGIVLLFQIFACIRISNTSKQMNILINSTKHAKADKLGPPKNKIQREIILSMERTFNELYKNNKAAWFQKWANKNCKISPFHKVPITFPQCEYAMLLVLIRVISFMRGSSMFLAVVELIVLICAYGLLSMYPKPKSGGILCCKKKKSRKKRSTFSTLTLMRCCTTFMMLISIALTVLSVYVFVSDWKHFVNKYLLLACVIYGCTSFLVYTIMLCTLAKFSVVIFALFLMFMLATFLFEIFLTVISGEIDIVLSRIVSEKSPVFGGFLEKKVYQYLHKLFFEIYNKPPTNPFRKWLIQHCRSHLSLRNLFVSTNGENLSSTIDYFTKCEVPLANYLQPAASLVFISLIVFACFHFVFLVLSSSMFFKKCKDTMRKKYPSKPTVDKEDTLLESDMISYEDAIAKYMASIPSGHHRKLEVAIDEFKSLWQLETGWNNTNDDGSITIYQFEFIIRKLIISRLTNKSKLDISVNLTADGKYILLKISASQDVLEYEASKVGYKLKFKDAVDPSKKYWADPTNLRKEKKVYDKATATNKLNMLFSQNHIPPRERKFFPYETPSQLSSRIHIHQRSTLTNDQLRIDNQYPAHAAYVKCDHIQYLFKGYRNKLDGDMTKSPPSIFRTIDRLVIIKSLLEEQYDFNKMYEMGIIKDFFALHSCSKFDLINIDNLYSNWITFWKPVRLPGELSSFKENKSKGASVFCFLTYLNRIYPFRQPISQVRDYFGEKIALYFTWIGFYAEMLVFPALFSLILILVTGNVHAIRKKDVLMETSKPSTKKMIKFEGDLSPETLSLVVFTILWAFIYVKSWSRKMPLIAIKWGTDGFEEEEQDRPQFKGTPEMNPVTNKVENYFPIRKRNFRQLLSNIIILIFVCIHMFIVLIIGYLQGHFVRWLGPVDGTFAGSLLQAALIQIATVLNDWENYRTQTEFDDGLILKIFFFQLFNNFTALYITAFIKKSAFGCAKVNSTNSLNERGTGSCMHELESLLVAIYITRLFLNVGEIGLPLINQYLASRARKQSISSIKQRVVKADVYEIEYELTLQKYEDTFEDYMEMVLQYGFVTLFVGALPLSPIFAFIECTIEIRIDAYKLCCLMKRPFPQKAEDIGSWFTYLVLITRLSIVTNLGIYMFTAGNCSHLPIHKRTIIFFLSALLALILFEIMWLSVSDESSELDETRKRNKFVVDKYLKGINSEDVSSNYILKQKEAMKEVLEEEVMDKLSDAREAATFVNSRVHLLEKFERIHNPGSFKKQSANNEKKEVNEIEENDVMVNEDPIAEELTPNIHSYNTELAGMDAIQEAVRRSTYSFEDEDSKWESVGILPTEGLTEIFFSSVSGSSAETTSHVVSGSSVDESTARVISNVDEPTAHTLSVAHAIPATNLDTSDSEDSSPESDPSRFSENEHLLDVL